MKKQLLVAAIALFGIVAGTAQTLSTAKTTPQPKSVQPEVANVSVRNYSAKALSADIRRNAKLTTISQRPSASLRSDLKASPRKANADGVMMGRPEGAFYNRGTLSSGGSFTSVLVPPFTPFKFYNYCDEASSAVWSINYGDESEEMEGNEDYDLDYEMSKGSSPYSLYYAPSITVGDVTDQLVDFVQPVDSSLYAFNYLNTLKTGYYYFSNGSPFMTEDIDFDFDEDGVPENYKCGGIRQFFTEKPMQPLVLHDIYLPFYSTLEAPLAEGQSLTCIIRKVYLDDEGYYVTGDEIARMEVTAEDLDRPDPVGSDYFGFEAVFANYEEDEFGTLTAAPIILDDMFAIDILGFDNEGTDIELFAGFLHQDDNEFWTRRTRATRIVCNNLDGTEYTEGTLAYYNTNPDNPYGYCAIMFLEGEMDGLEVGDYGEQTVPVEGGESGYVDEEDGSLIPTFLFTNFPMYEIDGDNAEWTENYDFEGVPDWAEVRIDPTYYDNEEYTNYRGLHMVWFECEPLPEGMKGRTATIKVTSARGAVCEGVITLTQGEAVAGLPEADFADGKYFLANVASLKFWGAGNEWGTQASLVEHAEYVTLLKQEDGTYILDSQVSNGGESHYLGMVDNGDYYMDNNQPVHLTITTTGILGYRDEDESVPVYTYTIANGDSYFGYDGESTVLGKNLAADSDEAQWVIVSYEEAVEALAEATEDDPQDATFLILDPNFGRNNRNQNAWIVSEDCTNKNLSGGNNLNNCAESWHSAFTISQTLQNVPNGVYKLTAQGFYRQDGTDENLPYFFINGEKRTFPLMAGTENSMSDASVSFTNGLYTIKPIFVEVKDNTITLGTKNESNLTIWAIWDNFELEYYGADADINNLKPAEEDPELVAPEGWTSGITNGNLAGDNVSSYVSKEAPSADILGATIVAGAGKGGSRGIVVKSADSPSQAWDTQFWIVLDKPMKVGTKMHVQFDYKASKNAASNTQAHGAPGNYNHWACIGDVNFTTEWQTYSTDIEITGDMSKADNPMQSIAFNLAVETTATEYYFDNFGVWYQEPAPVAEWADIIVNGDMEGKDTQCFYVTEQGVGGPFLAKTTPGIGKDGGSAIKVQSADSPAQDWDTQFFIRFPYQLPAGTKFRVAFDYKADKAGDYDTQAHAEPGAYIHWAAIGSGSFSTEWKTFEAEGVVSSDMSKEGQLMQTIAFNLAKNKVATEFIFDNVKFEIEKSVKDNLTPNPAVNPIPYPEPVDPNELIVNGSLEGEDVVSFVSKENAGDPFPSIITDGAGVDGSRGIRVTSAAGAAQDWDAQFWIVLPEPLEAGTEFHVEFDYKASMNASADTQAHGVPSFYHHWMCIGSPSFTEEWQHYSYDATVGSEWIGPNGDGDVTGFKSIAFNLSKDKANTVDFYFDNISVKLVVPEGITKVYNFSFEEGATYNLRGQKVDASYKGIVIRNGRKMLQK